ncbi:hypothetical protein R2R35_18670 [Anaerocolumna sp. AGMB13020]|uniref:hypothetical protein n=1 Tax=Anaerocolumna sp. AGMB13020 TaxID=3081750 RepID=UPI002954E238|nr:hypothetical protein [Anaerocolumna sp. AGMB13020]WOO35805.1 hypothetical protein R2R35_18670 [Anaerocolumna sp. AGMB13020]
MKSYVFYFDESFHDRKILVNKNGQINAMADNSLESYIGVFWGCEKDELGANVKILKRFEERQKDRFGLTKEQELKSTIIKSTNYKYGIHSFNKNTLAFYQDFFEILDFISPIIQINAISKIEFFIRRAFENVKMPDYYYFNKNVFYYTLTKFMIFYHNIELLNSLYNIHDDNSFDSFRKLLLLNLEYILKAIDGIERKKSEINAYSQLYEVISVSTMKMDFAGKFDFCYYANFEGLANLLSEKEIDINFVSVVIDKEEKTTISAKQFCFSSVMQEDSKEMIQIRFSDLISGFIGRFLYALSHDKGLEEDKVGDIRKIKDNNLEEKRIISKEWFDLSEEQFELYKIMYNVLIIQHQEYWTCMTLSYNDEISCFFTLMRYVAGYREYKKFIRINNKLHSEYYNAACCEELQRHYASFYDASKH